MVLKTCPVKYWLFVLWTYSTKPSWKVEAGFLEKRKGKIDGER
jgi:hypothetical protein